MKLATSAQMREADKCAIENSGITGVALMERAAGHLAVAVMEHVPLGGLVVAFCGTGNNGGDGIGAAAYLLEKGIKVYTYIIGKAEELKADARLMLQRYEALGGSFEYYSESLDLGVQIKTCSVIIDAIYGIGLNAVVHGDALSAISLINSSKTTVISARL